MIRRKTKSNPKTAQRSLLKLRACAEQAKHILSTTATTQCSIDALFDGIDLDCNVSRYEQQSMIKGRLFRMNYVLDYVSKAQQVI